MNGGKNTGVGSHLLVPASVSVYSHICLSIPAPSIPISMSTPLSVFLQSMSTFYLYLHILLIYVIFFISWQPYEVATVTIS